MMNKNNYENKSYDGSFSKKIKNSIVVKLMVTIIIIFIGMMTLSNFMINICVNNYFQEFDVEIENIFQTANHDDLYLLINEAQVKSTLEFRLYIILIMLFTVLIGCFFLYFIISHMMKPLKSLAEQVSEIDIHNIEDLNQEIVAIKGGYEIEDLAHTFNVTLKKLYLDYESQKKFSSNVAHELRTPLAVLYSKIDVFGKKSERNIEEYEELITSLKFNIERLADLVSKILLLTKKSNNIKLINVCLKDIVEEIVFDLEGTAEEKSVTATITGDNISMCTDDGLIQRVLFNLIENAIKYNVNNGKVNINLSKNDTDTIIEIADTGIGITDEHKEKVFDIFYRVEQSRNRALGGYGIGLALVESIVKVLGGKIFIRDNKPQGTIFVLSFQNIDSKMYSGSLN
ncbi:sensor histidine kinase [Clostridium tetani]|nr:sensor histidine kinase [Clostridium tetani]